VVTSPEQLAGMLERGADWADKCALHRRTALPMRAVAGMLREGTLKPLLPVEAVDPDRAPWSSARIAARKAEVFE
jgi:hypothetical protein